MFDNMFLNMDIRYINPILIEQINLNNKIDFEYFKTKTEITKKDDDDKWGVEND